MWLLPESAIYLGLWGNSHRTHFRRVSEQVWAAVHAHFLKIILSCPGPYTYLDLTLSHHQLSTVWASLSGFKITTGCYINMGLIFCKQFNSFPPHPFFLSVKHKRVTLYVQLLSRCLASPVYKPTCTKSSSHALSIAPANISCSLYAENFFQLLPLPLSWSTAFFLPLTMSSWCKLAYQPINSCCWLSLNNGVAKMTASYCSSKACLLDSYQGCLNEVSLPSTQCPMPDEGLGYFI